MAETDAVLHGSVVVTISIFSFTLYFIGFIVSVCLFIYIYIYLFYEVAIPVLYPFILKVGQKSLFE